MEYLFSSWFRESRRFCERSWQNPSLFHMTQFYWVVKNVPAHLRPLLTVFNGLTHHPVHLAPDPENWDSKADDSYGASASISVNLYFRILWDLATLRHPVKSWFASLTRWSCFSFLLAFWSRIFLLFNSKHESNVVEKVFDLGKHNDPSLASGFGRI